jgi:sugar lactone lactonase YvrE
MSKPAISPQRWTPPKAVTTAHPLPLRNFQIHPMPGSGPEHVTPGKNGDLLTGLDDGRVISYDPKTRRHNVIVDTSGRPLGMAWHPDGSLIICDAQRGLLASRPDGSLDVLASGYQGTSFTFCSNVTVTDDGTIYFSHSSQKYNLANWTGDIIEHRPTGQLFRYNTDGTLELLLDGLGFANGVALSADESFLVVAQTVGYDLLKLDLTGDAQGAVTRFGEAMPGMPDNIAADPGGNIWVSIVAPRIGAVDYLLPRNPLWRKVVWALPERLLQSAQGTPSTGVRVLDATGAIVYDFIGTHPDFGNPTAVWPVGDKVWLASLPSNALAGFDLPTDRR